MGANDHLSNADLLRLVDREAAADRIADWTTHLIACSPCRDRYHDLTALTTNTTEALRSDATVSAADHFPARTALARRLVEASRVRQTNTESRVRQVSSVVARWSTVAAAVVAVLLTARMLRSRPRSDAAPLRANIERGALPISTLTPGATADVTIDQLCGGNRRDATPADPVTREGILRDYGMAEVPEHEYELDYLITPELGGTNDRRNLWPERYSDRTWNAKVKDQLEDLLPSLVCEGKVDLRTAQRDISANWVEAYKKYFKTDTPIHR